MLRVKEIRKSKGMTQIQLAKMSGVSRSYISELENDGYTISIYILCKLCKALAVTPNDLIEEENWK
ncbi:MAG: helix-turn-helix transcriptional regulator [Clostridium sp.]